MTSGTNTERGGSQRETPGHDQSTRREELTRLSGGSPVLADMLKNNIPLTREHYLALAYGGELPDPWTAEHELEVPGPFQAPLPA